MTTALAQSIKLAKLGGDYQADQNDDGTWNVRDIEILAAAEIRTTNGNTFEITKEWLEGALATAQSNRSNRYMAPAHINHHPNATEDAGKILPTAVRRVMFKGRPTDVLFADLVEIPDEIYQRIKAGRLPYRSVEIHDVEQMEVNSIALMNTADPFFQFPMTTVGKENRSVATVQASGSFEPMIALAARGSSIAFLYSGDSMNDKEKEAAKLAEEAEKKEEEKKEEDGAKAMDEGGTMLKVLLAIAKKLGVQVEEQTPMEPGEEPESGGPAEMKKTAKDPEVAAQLQSMQGKISQLEKSNQADLLVAEAVKALAGYATGDNLEAEIKAQALDGGKPAVDKFVATIKKYGAKEPGNGEDGNAMDTSYPEEVLKFQAEGPERLEQAAKFSKEFDGLSRVHTIRSMGRERYIRGRMVEKQLTEKKTEE